MNTKKVLLPRFPALPKLPGLGRLGFGWKAARLQHKHGTHLCLCPNCGYELPVGVGVACNTQTCPSCGARMRAKETGEYRSSKITMPLPPVSKTTKTSDVSVSPVLTPTLANLPRWVEWDIIRVGTQLYTVRGVDAYDQKYLLGVGSYPYDTVMDYWMPCSRIDPYSTYVGHVKVIYFE